MTTNTTCPQCGGTGSVPTYPTDPTWVGWIRTMLLLEMALVVLVGVVLELIPALRAWHVPYSYWTTMGLFVSFAMGLCVAGWSPEPTRPRPSLRGRMLLACLVGCVVVGFILYARHA